MITLEKIESVVIVKCKEGYKAHLRFTDDKLDIDLSHSNKNSLHYLIESYINKT